MSKTITVSDEQSSEPVAWRYIDCSDEGTCCHIYNEMKQGEPLYLHPRTPLSDEEIKQAIREAWVEWHEDVSYVYTPSMPTPAFIQGFKAAVKWMEEMNESKSNAG